MVFYDVMDYPVPKDKELFFLSHSIDDKPQNIDYSQIKFSWDTKSKYMPEYIQKINKYWWLYRSLPFVQDIYLCNSITFNALNSASDIDLFIVVKNNRLWLARFFSAFLFFVLWQKRTKISFIKKFCLSFYVTQDSMNLYPISLKPMDLYLIYWLAHLVPLYLENPWNNNIYENNKWINSFLLNFPMQHVINIWTKQFTWSNWFKRFIERIFGWIIWNIFEKFIKVIWIPVIITKNKKLWKKARWVFVSDKMLKFHWNDIRKKVNLKYKLKS